MACAVRNWFAIHTLSIVLLFKSWFKIFFKLFKLIFPYIVSIVITCFIMSSSICNKWSFQCLHRDFASLNCLWRFVLFNYGYNLSACFSYLSHVTVFVVDFVYSYYFLLSVIVHVFKYVLYIFYLLWMYLPVWGVNLEYLPATVVVKLRLHFFVFYLFTFCLLSETACFCRVFYFVDFSFSLSVFCSG